MRPNWRNALVANALFSSMCFQEGGSSWFRLLWITLMEIFGRFSEGSNHSLRFEGLALTDGLAHLTGSQEAYEHCGELSNCNHLAHQECLRPAMVYQ